IDGELTGEDVPAAFLGLEADAVAGTCSFRLDVGGTPDSPSCEGELWAQNVVLWGREIRILRSRLSGNRHLLSLDQLRAEIASGGSLEGYLSFDFKTDRIASTRLDIISANISSFADLIPEAYAEIAPSGLFNASFERLLMKDDAAWRFSVESSRMDIASAPVEEVSINGMWLEHRLDRLAVSARIGNGNFTLNGHQLHSDGYTGDIALHDVDLSLLGAAVHFKSPLRGIITADGSIIWNEKSPAGRLSVIVRDLGIGDRFLGNGGGEILIDRSGVTMNKAAFDRMGLQLSGKLSFKQGNPYTLYGSMKRTDLSAFPAACGLRSFQKGDLLVTGACTAEGRVDRSQPDRVNASIQSLEIRRGKDLIVANRPMQVLYQNGIVELRSFELKYRQGIFGAEGIWDPRGKTALTLSGRDFSIHALGNLLEIPDWTVDGSLSFDGGIVGSFPDIRLDARVDIRDLAYRERKIPEITGKIELTPEQLMLESVLV
ncbi:MAG TPA: hypothetical protein PKM25_18030, partial [Candidatus Ozemobacteraceae bacterium]|nr:hypothetical protein [Candidatus Ozemobacteraceae bacterium]